ncbi:amidohydrolase family protein [Seohaeicola zhoushanensis]|uniref:Amidohydrolase n=1 Tax=Seohaeicola zhoushanensis TaxID=1569283 RepID=A0A8J3GZG7_9RHOB|nr:amidohydrolase family protein [Seohaeicola zhoushanensis]GHF58497.1 amidohydrolase [Seohaeicola zhoushanensis]
MNASGGRYQGWVAGMELRDDWLAQVQEEIIDPAREIIDPHHHLWVHGTPEAPAVYEMEALWRDTGSGHNVVATMFMECRSYWDMDAPAHLQSVGESRRVAEMAASAGPGQSKIAGIICNIDPRLEPGLLDEAIDAHLEAGQGLVQGVRFAGARDSEPEKLVIPGRGAEGQYADTAFRRGLQRFAERGLTFDTWHYHPQNGEYLDLARALPEVTMILDHFGGPLGVGRFTGRRDEYFADWQRDMEAIAACPNVHAKLGGFLMPDNGWGFHQAARPATSDEVVALQGKWYAHMLDVFGPERCMFESNFPVDRISVSYPVIWNAFKKMAAGFSEAEKDALFAGTVRRVYGV